MSTSLQKAVLQSGPSASQIRGLFGRVREVRPYHIYWNLGMAASPSVSTIHFLIINEDGSMNYILNAFEGGPRILRLFGKGRVLEAGTPEFDEIVARENIVTIAGTRSVIVVDVHQVGTSCGYQVPFFNFVDYRYVLRDHFRKKEERFLRGDENESMDRYWAYKNAWSVDGLPAMRRGLKAGEEFSVAPIKKMVGKMALKSAAQTRKDQLHAAYLVIALLVAMIAVLAVTHPAFQFFPAQKRMTDLVMSRVSSMPGGYPSATQLQ
ncbi:pyridoxamine phosphate oxidase family protein [Xylariaceae sp. FL0594]|nr:pyridoxamine phosphate oxidase family protein [Xylariaceae sp. FL0594]